MTQTATNYGRVLYDLGVSKEVVAETRKIFSLTSELPKVLNSPIVSLKVKHDLIEKIFPQEIRSFLKVLCDYQSVDQIEAVFMAYDEYFDEQNGILRAVLYYVTAPEERQLQQMRDYLGKKYGRKQVEIKLIQKPDLIGGFVVRVKDVEEDWSMKGRLNKLQRKLIWR